VPDPVDGNGSPICMVATWSLETYHPKMRRLSAGITAVAIVALGITGVATAAPPSPQAGSPVSCDPVGTKPQFRGAVPSPQEVLGFRLGSREATDQEIGKYWGAVDRASNRVVTGVFAQSLEGRPLRYALVGPPQTLQRLPDIRRDIMRVRNPSTPQRQAAALIRRTPTILWITANVHGNEPAGGDAVLQLLYHLADRSDCVARAILDNAVVGLIPVQNPDGRAHNRRYNAAAFDMNRDVGTATQPEVAGRLKLLWKYPPQLVVDEHEMGGSNYFFPPNADPIYHETPNLVYDEIEHVYGTANAAAFEAKGWRYETWRSGYDFFAQEYGDTVPTTQMGAAGMTYEQGTSAPYPQRVRHQFTAGLVSLYAGATHRESILRNWRETFVQAKAEGAACRLERNKIFNPGHRLQRQVPDRPVCGYFLPGHSPETRLVVHRLQTAHVIVDRLTRPTVVPDYRPYGRAPRRATLPAGTYWISLAQAQKHWVQAVLNEDTYVPFPYFYDVSGWSLPLFAGIHGGSTGTQVTAPVAKVPPLAAPAPPRLPRPLPRIAVLDQFTRTINDYQNTGWLKWRLSHDWHMPYTVLQPEQVNAASLKTIDVLLVGNVDASPVYRQLGAAGRAALDGWVRQGGRFVAWQEGALLASALGLSSVGMDSPKAQSPGALMRIRDPQGMNEIMWSDDYDLQLTPNDARVVAAFTGRMFVSGFVKGAETLAGTPVEAVDRLGDGSVTVFGFEPNFRAVSDGSARLLLHSILQTPTGSVPATAPQGSPPTDPLSLGHTQAEHLAYDNREMP
jgi:hypothetical protein